MNEKTKNQKQMLEALESFLADNLPQSEESLLKRTKQLKERALNNMYTNSKSNGK